MSDEAIVEIVKSIGSVLVILGFLYFVFGEKSEK